MLESIFNNSSITLTQILICSMCSLIYGFIIALSHKYTSKYSKNFLITISLIPFLVQMIIIMVNGNLGTSVAIVGAFSLIRFRSMPGTSKEILTVFFAMTVGLSNGMGNIGVGAIITIVGSLAMFLFNNTKLFEKQDSEKILKISISENLNYTNIFDEEFEEFTEKAVLEQVKTTNMGSIFELSYKINIKKNIDEKKFIDALRIKNGNLKIILTQDLVDREIL